MPMTTQPRWLDPAWTYHKSESHSDPEAFRAPMQAYAEAAKKETK